MRNLPAARTLRITPSCPCGELLAPLDDCGRYARLTARRPLTTPEDRENYCLFLLHFTRKAPPAYCKWKAPVCTFPALVTGLGGCGTHTAAVKLKEAGLMMPHESVRTCRYSILPLQQVTAHLPRHPCERACVRA
jgi:hypothetical protein